MDVERSSVVKEAFSPDTFDDIVASAHHSLMPQEIEQQAILCFGEHHRLARLQGPVRGSLDKKVGVTYILLHLNVDNPPL